MDTMTEQEKLIEQYLGKGNQDAAVKALYDLIVDCAKKHDFFKAEALRDRLFEIAPMALNEISRSADIIDEEKSRAIDEGHRKKWAKLYSTLTTEEANELYFAMKERVYRENEKIFSVGDADNNLYFLDSGEARMVYMKENEEILKVMEPGDIAGEDTFFYTTSAKTVTLIASSKAKMHILDRNVQERWKDRFPALEQKLHEYCEKSGRVSDILMKKGMSRRQNRRVKINGKVSAQLLQPSGTPAGKPFLGEICDISESGLSFNFKFSNNDVAHKILGAKIKTQLVVPVGGVPKKIEQTGKIVGIGYYVFSEYSVHVRFDETDITLKRLIR
ncbi:MAG: cyclic nucleotide-binding domain-containing protein [Deltaproteobacteria bacterium]|nr:cyclic nucleotide-binding domain-containing protein [Deltaproteobacteria bacterium]